MPELPEVETIKQDLKKKILDKAIKEIEVNTAKVIKEPAKISEFRKQIKGERFKEILRRGKVLIFSLSSGKYMVAHMKLTGQFIYGAKDKVSRVNFQLSDGKYLNFNDQRLFAELRLVKNFKEIPLIKKMGPEPLEGSFTEEKFKEMLRIRRTLIKPLLMDQAFLAGIGNIYAVEVLFRAGINPKRKASTLKSREASRLFTQIKKVLNEAIKYRGASVDTYRDVQGEKGSFEKRLQVYSRGGKPCFRCKGPIKRIALGGRGTYFCPKCQK